MESKHPIQLKILSRLLFNPKSRFKDLNIEAIGTDDFSYHLRSLTGSGLIIKEGQQYSLTAMGKMVAGKIDTTSQTIEKQPKVSIILIPHKNISNQSVYLIQKRTKEPYFGYWGFIAGKIKFGETITETAARELYEEAGLTGKFRFCYEIHEMVYNKTSTAQLEDKFFHVVEAYNLVGNFSEKTIEGKINSSVLRNLEQFRQNTTMKMTY